MREREIEREEGKVFFPVSGSPCPVDCAPPQTFTGLWRANPIRYLVRLLAHFPKGKPRTKVQLCTPSSEKQRQNAAGLKRSELQSSGGRSAWQLPLHKTITNTSSPVSASQWPRYDCDYEYSILDETLTTTGLMSASFKERHAQGEIHGQWFLSNSVQHNIKQCERHQRSNNRNPNRHKPVFTDVHIILPSCICSKIMNKKRLITETFLVFKCFVIILRV